jgi:hypothetical protein
MPPSATLLAYIPPRTFAEHEAGHGESSERSSRARTCLDVSTTAGVVLGGIVLPVATTCGAWEGVGRRGHHVMGWRTNEN